MYAKEALGALDIFTEIEEDIVYAKDVRQVLSYVETGNVEAGIVYRTDALLSDKVEIVHEFPQSLHTPVRYPAGVIADSPNHETAVEFQEFLHSETVQKVFEKYGFIIQ
jgi:molybdate transport system substrate-binding protein